jgi:hypothetical protein
MDQQIRELREFLIRVDDTALTPGGAAQFCGIFREIFNLLFQDFKNNSSLASHGLSDEEIRKVDGVFAERSDDFFLMARFNTPLSQQQIIKQEDIRHTMRSLEYLEVVLSQTIDRCKDVRSILQEYP